jgi:ribosomal protein S18 acetylase RimI-like enzyme
VHQAHTATRPVRLQPRQRPRAVETLVQAFRDDPMWVFIAPDEAERRRALRPVWDAVIRDALLFGEVWTVPGITGVASWISPGRLRSTFWRTLRTGFAVPRAMRYLRGEARRRADAVWGHEDALHEQAMPGPHWYLELLGVAPESQGQGIGSILLAPVLERADAAGLPCYLETERERNVAFYRKQGFEVLTAGPVPGHGLMVWTMARGPRL